MRAAQPLSSLSPGTYELTLSPYRGQGEGQSRQSREARREASQAEGCAATAAQSRREEGESTGRRAPSFQG